MLDLTKCSNKCSECSFDPLVVCRMHAPLIYTDEAEHIRQLERLCRDMWGFIAKMPNLFVATSDEYIRFGKELKELEVIA